MFLLKFCGKKKKQSKQQNIHVFIILLGYFELAYYGSASSL